MAWLRSSTNSSFSCAFASSPIVHSRTLSGVLSGRETSSGRGFPHPDADDALRTSSYIGVAAGVCGRAASPLPLGERGDQLAAEGWDVRDHATPHQERGIRETLEHDFEGPLRLPRMAAVPRLVWTLV